MHANRNSLSSVVLFGFIIFLGAVEQFMDKLFFPDEACYFKCLLRDFNKMLKIFTFFSFLISFLHIFVNICLLPGDQKEIAFSKLNKKIKSFCV